MNGDDCVVIRCFRSVFSAAHFFIIIFFVCEIFHSPVKRWQLHVTVTEHCIRNIVLILCKAQFFVAWADVKKYKHFLSNLRFCRFFRLVLCCKSPILSHPKGIVLDSDPLAGKATEEHCQKNWRTCCHVYVTSLKGFFTLWRYSYWTHLFPDIRPGSVDLFSCFLGDLIQVHISSWEWWGKKNMISNEWREKKCDHTLQLLTQKFSLIK